MTTRSPARPSTKTVLSLSALALLITGAVLYAGPLNPPAGPVTSTYKTLTEVEPRTAINAANTPGDADSLFKITTHGSYYLTGNITGVAGKHGIEIAASGVTLDLNGFDMVGVAGMGAFDGVSVTVNNLRNIAVVNGSVRNWGDEGVDLGGINTVSNSRVADLLASDNTGSGISVGLGCTVTNCSAFFNTGNGISTGASCTVSNCTATSNGAGSGIITSAGCTVSNCASLNNAASGINVLDACTVADCVVRANNLDGIVCGTLCVIRSNTCSLNGFATGDGSGIHATGADNHIEGNTCTGADRGIGVDAAGNIIIRNTCTGNTLNWNVVAGNVILVVNATTAGVVAGNSGGTAPGSTDPNANFTY